jgi:transcriptional regulator GlxA family with amidase domain
MAHEVVFLVFPDFQLLDLTGPVAAFEIAGRYVPGSYTLRVAAARPGLVRSSSGLALPAGPFGPARSIDTLIIAGGDGSRVAMQQAGTQRFLRACARQARRVASVCSGTYLLAAAGLLEGRCATTHWSLAGDFASRFPGVRLEPDRIFVRDGAIWTSAGITAGIDLALALIAEDLGEATARRTARQMVVYYRRPGGQSQFSELLDSAPASGRFAQLQGYLRTHLQRRLSVEDLAAQAAMSPRHFARRFVAETGVTPARFVERLRAEAARAALESGALSLQRIARQCGFGDPQRLRRSLIRVYGAPPSAWMRRTAGARSAVLRYPGSRPRARSSR